MTVNIAIPLVIALGGLQSQPADVIVPSVQLRPMHDVEVPARETGPLVELVAEDGGDVKEGTVLARIDAADARSAVAEAIADYEVAAVEAKSQLGITSAEKDHAAASRNRQRADDANKLRPNSVLEFELDKLRLAEAQTKLAVAQAKLGREKAERTAAARAERVTRAKEKLNRHVVISPISGSVVESRFEPGEWVEAGQVVARVIQIDRLKAEGILVPSQVSGKLVGSPVTVKVKVGDRALSLKGTVTFVSSEARSGKIRFRAVVENPGKLVRPGLRSASMTIRTRATAERSKPTGSRR